MEESLDARILDTLYDYCESGHWGDPKMMLGELRSAIGVSEEWQLQSALQAMEDKKLIQCTLSGDGLGGSVKITSEGIRTAQDRRENPPPSPPPDHEICIDLVPRDDLLQDIDNRFAQGHFVVLYGEPKVGKTELLKQLSEVWNDKCVPLLVECQGLEVAVVFTGPLLGHPLASD